MNWKGFGRKQPWPNFKVIYRHSSGRTEESYGKPQSGDPVSGPRFEHGTSRIRSISKHHPMKMYGCVEFLICILDVDVLVASCSNRLTASDRCLRTLWSGGWMGYRADMHVDGRESRCMSRGYNPGRPAKSQSLN
jgi:hypothetical protein